MNVLAITFAARHRRKSDKFSERAPRCENQLQNHQLKQWLYRTTSRPNLNHLAAPIEKKTGAPWLKKFTEKRSEVIRKLNWDAVKNSGSWTIATPAEIEAGIFFESADGYRKDNLNPKDKNNEQRFKVLES